MSDLTLPGTIPGLLRRGSPVVATSPLLIGGITCHALRAIIDGNMMLCALGAVVVSGDVVALDLTDATGRAHAAWWLASAVGLHSPTTSRWSPGASVYTIESDAQSAPWVRTFTSPGSLWSGERVPALADLDPNNDRRLPDGSRQVDAEALRRVVLHVAGVQA